MYLGLLKINMDKSPCKKELDFMEKSCVVNSLKCNIAKRKLKMCIRNSVDSYKYMQFWKTHAKEVFKPPQWKDMNK